MRYGDDANQTQTYAECNADLALGPYVHSAGKRTFSDVDAKGVLVSANWDSDGEIGGLDNLDVRLNASYRKVDTEYLFDNDYSSFLINAMGTGAGPKSTITRGGEIIVEGVVNDRLDFVTGVHYFNEESGASAHHCHGLFKALFDGTHNSSRRGRTSIGG